MDKAREKTVSRLEHLLLASVFAVSCFAAAQANADNKLRILPLGDSITQGGNEKPSYRRALWFMLERAGYNVDFIGSQRDFHDETPPDSLLDFDLDHEGHWGWETNQIADALPDWLDLYTADIALVHLGTNDFDRGEAIPDTLKDLEAVLALLRRDNPEITILLAEIIPMRFKSTRGFNEALRHWASDRSTASSKLMMVNQFTGYYPLLYNYDKYHANSMGEKRIARRWFDAIQTVVGSSSESVE